MKAEISIDIEGDDLSVEDLSVEVEAYANIAVLRFGDLAINMSSAQFDLLLKEMRRWILENDDA